MVAWKEHWETAKKSTLDYISEIPLPREAVIVNVRLGILFWTFWAGALFAAVGSILSDIYQEHSPLHLDVTYWREEGDYYAGPEPEHCVNLDKYTYVYNKDWTYNIKRCRTLVDGQDWVKTSTGILFMTLAQETLTQREVGAACSSMAVQCAGRNASFGASGEASHTCTAEGAQPDCGLASQALHRCECSASENFYIRNQEKTKMLFRHSYKVKDSWHSDSVERANSGNAFFFTGTFSDRTKVEKQLLTRILKADGTPCKVGGQSDYLSGTDIGGSIEEWLACGGMSLDSQSALPRSWDPSENIEPHLRTTGVKVVLEMKYENRHKDAKKGNVNTVCEIKVRVLPAWVSREVTDFGSGRRADTPADVIRQQRTRYFYSVAFEFQQTASFAFFNPRALLNGVVKAIVLFSVPTILIRFITLYGIGLVSSIYKKFLRHPFNIFDEIHKVSISLMFSAVGFRLWTKQFDTKQKVHEMKDEELVRAMKEAFDMELNDPEGYIDEAEFDRCSKIVLAGINIHTDEGVQQDEYVHAACSQTNSFGDSRLMLEFFNEARRRWPLERLLDPTREQIRKANKKCDERLRVSGKKSLNAEESSKEEAAPEQEEATDPTQE